MCLDCHNSSSESQINYIRRVEDFLSRLNHIGIAGAKSLSCPYKYQGQRVLLRIIWIRFNRIVFSEVNDTKVSEFPFIITTKHSQINGSWKTVRKPNTENCRQITWNRSQGTVEGNIHSLKKKYIYTRKTFFLFTAYKWYCNFSF